MGLYSHKRIDGVAAIGYRRSIVGDGSDDESGTGFGGHLDTKTSVGATTRAHGFVGRGAIAVLAAAAVVACGAGAKSAATKSGTTAPTRAAATVPAVPTPTAAPPTGGQAPSLLIGSWYQVASSTTVLTLTATRYILRDTAEQGTGDIVVSRQEIDFFSGTLCSLVLPQGVGRYHWTLQGVHLHLAPLNTDPCGRIGLLTNQSFTKRLN
jgi:hypothetical protein